MTRENRADFLLWLKRKARAERALAALQATASQRPLTKGERQALLNVRALIRRLTGNHFAA